MESECVVCGSPHDSHALRCVVCGVDLPPTLIGTQASSGELNTLTSLQGLSSPLKLPLSTGVAFHETPDSEEFAEERDPLLTHGEDLLLGPEELSISSPPASQAQSPSAQSTTLSGTPAVSLDEDFDLSTSIGVPRRDASGDSPYRVELSPQLRDFPSETRGREAELPSSPDLSPVSDHVADEVSSSNTWVGVPIPQTSIELDVARVLASQSAVEAQDQVNQIATQIGMAPVQGLSSADLSPIRTQVGAPLASQDAGQGEEPPPLIAPVTPRASSAVPNPLEARYSSHLEERERREQSASQQDIDAIEVSAGEEVAPLKEPPPVAQSQVERESDSVEREVAQEAVGRSTGSSSTGSSSTGPSDRHITTTELKPYRREDRLKWLPWVGLVLVSAMLGVYLTTYLEEHTPADQLESSTSAQVEVTLSAPQYHLDRYRLRAKITSRDEAQLLTPDSWSVLEGQENLAPMKGERDVLFELSKDQIALGLNTLNAQWLFQGEGAPPPRPAPLKVRLDWELIRLEAQNVKSGELNALIQTTEGVLLSGSDVPYEPAAQPGQYLLKIPRAQVRTLESGDEVVVVKLTLQRSPAQGEEASPRVINQEATLAWPREPATVQLQSPTRNYARPDKEVVISGLSDPTAKVRVASMTLNKREVTLENEIATLADARGLFSLSVPLSAESNKKIPKDGLIWSVEIEVIAAGKLPTTRTVKVKRSHQPTWRAYINRLERRRGSAMQRYARFSQPKLVQSPDLWTRRAGVISGTVAWIDRGVTSEEARALKGLKVRPQRFLVYTCSQGDRCPIWVRDPLAFWVKVDQPIYVFGVFEGVQTHRGAQGDELSLPEIKSRLMTP